MTDSFKKPVTKNPTILFTCRFPPPHTGQTIGSKLTFDLVNTHFKCDYFPIIHSAPVGRAGKFRLLGVLHTFKNLSLLTQLIFTKRYDIIYFVPGCSTYGHLRDIALLFIVSTFIKPCPIIIAHVRCGNFAELFQKKSLVLLNNYFIGTVTKFIFLSLHLSLCSASNIPDNKRVIIHNPIDDEIVFSNEDCSNKIQDRQARRMLNLFFISNMIVSKGYLDFARALNLLPRSLRWHAHFVGAWKENFECNKFETYLRQNSLESRTTIYGKITDRKTIKEMLKKADIFILPTYYPIEAQPRSIIEAMNAATPIISTRHASIPEYVKQGYNGYLVSYRSPTEIAEAIITLSDPEKWTKFALNARNTYIDLFSTKTIREQLFKVFS